MAFGRRGGVKRPLIDLRLVFTEAMRSFCLSRRSLCSESCCGGKVAVERRRMGVRGLGVAGGGGGVVVVDTTYA